MLIYYFSAHFLNKLCFLLLLGKTSFRERILFQGIISGFYLAWWQTQRFTNYLPNRGLFMDHISCLVGTLWIFSTNFGYTTWKLAANTGISFYNKPKFWKFSQKIMSKGHISAKGHWNLLQNCLPQLAYLWFWSMYVLAKRFLRKLCLYQYESADFFPIHFPSYVTIGKTTQHKTRVVNL